MDPKVRELLNKVKEGAVTYGKVAGKIASETAEKARLNLQIFDLNTEIDISYKEIGKLVYAMHAGEEVSNDAVQTEIEKIDARKVSLAEIRAKLASFKSNTEETCCCCGETHDACCCEDEEEDDCCCGDECHDEECHEHHDGCCCNECAEEEKPAEEHCCCEEKKED